MRAYATLVGDSRWAFPPGRGVFPPDGEFLTREGIDGSFWEFIAALGY